MRVGCRVILRAEAALALRYALAPACIGAAVVLHLSPAGPYLHTTGVLLLGVVAAAWFGGLGPALLAALLATLVFPRLPPMNYPLLADFFDLPRFITFSLAGAAVGWGNTRRRLAERKRAEMALRQSEQRYALAMEAAGDGHTDWNVVTGEFYVSPRLLGIVGFAPGTTFADRAEWVRRFPFHPEDRERWQAAVAAHFASREAKFKMDLRIIVSGETRWVAFTFIATRDAAGKVVRWTGSIADISDAKRDVATVLDTIPGLVAMLTPAGEVEAVNNQLAEYCGQPLEAMRQWGTNGTVHAEDLPRVADLFMRAISAGEPYDFEARIRRCDGVYRWNQVRGSPSRDSGGRIVRWYVVLSDIDDRKRAEEALLESEKRYEHVMLAADAGFWDWDAAKDEFYASPRLLEMSGLPPGTKLAGREDFLRRAAFHAEDRTRWQQAVKELFASGGSRVAMEVRSIVDGETIWHRLDGMCFRDEAGRVVRWTGSSTYVNERKRAEEALREQTERLKLGQAAMRMIIMDWNLAEDLLTWSDSPEWLRGPMPASGRYPPFKDQIHPEDRDRFLATRHRALETLEVQTTEFRLVRTDGEMTWVLERKQAFAGADGKAVRMLAAMFDITDRKRAEEALRRSQQYLAEAQSLSHIGSWAFNADGFQYWSAELFKIHGLDPGGKAPSIPEYLALVHPEDRDSVVREIERILAGAPGFDFKKRIVRPDGEIRLVRCVGIRANAGGVAEEFVGSGMDVTEQERAEEGLRKSEERFALAVAGSNEGIFDWDLAADRVYVSLRAQELFRLPPGEPWRPRKQWRNILNFHPDDRVRQHDAIKALIEGRGPLYDEEFRIILADNSVRWFRQRGIALLDAAGKVTRMVGSIGDITDRKVAQEELLRLERQLRQAQRLESLGTLAGGIAHDFNNILGAIVGYGEMALRGVRKDTRLRRDLDAIMSAGERGRTLVDRILAFSRSGVGERLPVHVEAVVCEALDQLGAKLPQSVTIEPRLRAGRAAMLGDSTQVHQVVMNLAGNGVQAMPGGGVLRVTLETWRCETGRAASVGAVAPGDYIVLQVGDAGTGIPPEVLERMFDPFFTTKEGGVGTGLGLSLVHGIVANVGGAIDVATELGKGSTFTVYLPRSGDAPAKAVQDKRPLPRGEGQRVLVVDDEEPLVRLATETLQNLGYAPVAFTSSTAALAAFRADPQRFDAVLTDERMPGMSGSALIREVRGIRDAIPVVLMSGYLGMQSVDADVVVRKPVSAGELAASMARALQP